MIKTLNKLIIISLFSFQLIFTEQKLILIEGNIGVGKSTFLNLLASFFPESICISEPCDEWQNIDGHNLLDAFYKDTKHMAYSMLSHVAMATVRKLQKSIIPTSSLYFMERSLYSAKYCFARNLVLMNMLTDLEKALYDDSWNWYNKQSIKPAAIIYLQTEPQVCYERMKVRARNEEEVVTLKYLQTLHDRHHEWLVLKQYGDKDVPVLVLNASLDFKNKKIIQEQFKEQICIFLQNEKII